MAGLVYATPPTAPARIDSLRQMKAMHLVAAVSVCVAATAAVSIYAVGAATAANLASGFSTTETTRHTSIVQFASTAKRLAAEHRAARDKCKSVAVAERRACNAAVRDQDRRAFGSHQY
jgi:hypothetical protein